MHLNEIRVKNFTSFRGETRIRFEKNLNIVYGQNGVGKTNLARAISLALTGMVPDDDPLTGLQLFNKVYMEECERDASTPKWEVEADVTLGGDCYSAVCRAMVSRGEAIFTHRSPVEVQSRAFHSHRNLYVRAEGRPARLSRMVIPAEEMATSRVVDRLREETPRSIGFAVIDADDVRISAEGLSVWLGRLEESDVEQVILLLNDEGDVEFSEVRANVICLGYDFEIGGTVLRPPETS